jgi:translation initiation factor IF-3
MGTGQRGEVIKKKEVRLIGQDGNQIGIVSMHKAIALSNDVGLDLINISPDANPPVYKILDVGKQKYERSKKIQQAKKKNTRQLKEIKLRPFIEDHDLQVKVKQITKQLDKGNRVKITVFFRGREISSKQFGFDVINKVVKEIEDICIIDKKPRLEGRNITMLIKPL